MTRTLCSALLAMAVIASAQAQFAPAVDTAASLSVPERYALTNATVLDGRGGPAQRNRVIVIEAGRIAAIGRSAPHGLQVYDLKGATVLPGLMDAHVHIADFAAMRKALDQGVTTARSMGVPKFTDVGLRDLARAGAVAGPELFAAGYHFYPRPPETFFTDFPQFAEVLSGGLKGADLMGRIAEAQLARGIDWIKVNATARASQPGDDPAQVLYGEAEIAALVRAGASRRVHVAAHAHGDDGARDALRAGARSIEHATFLSDATIALAKARGAYLVPTAVTVKNLATSTSDRIPETSRILGRRMWPALQRTVAEAHRAGVMLVAGTDTAYTPTNRLGIADEVAVLAEMGLSPAEALAAATINAADMLGIGHRTGAVAVGLEADLLVVRGDPLADLSTLKTPLMVISDGRIAVDARENK
ncbi:MAG: amidohydrolase family protein [Rhodospirillaceae bacterium]|nr:amidohydrolase family protein [Rhodospirillaceae bacterium]